MSVRLVLFGSPAIAHGGNSFVLPFERRSQLLVYLALKRAWVGRAELAALLWPEQATRLAYTNLRKTLFRLQSSPWAPPLESQGGALRLIADSDVAAFDAALREHDAATALALRSGELLAGFEDDANEAWSSWLAFERDRLRAAWRAAALERLDTALEPATGIELSARLLEADPLDEAALRAHIGGLARAGQGARARQAYREFVDRLERELGIEPGAELRALHEGLGATAASLRAAGVPAPAARRDDGFVGRSVELRHIGDLLAQADCRLLCITGPGGMGKTRLARRALQAFGPRFADGTAFVSLEDVHSAQEIGARLASELGAPLAGRGEPLAKAMAFVGQRQMLLALDNLEQIDGAAAPLEKLLTSCPQLTIVATSRARLASAMEWLLPLDGLPCPEPEDQDCLESFDAARLFVASARRVEPALLPDAEAAAIVEICQRVGGLPLALELAAAWTRLLSCDAIAAELRRGSELLHATDAAHPARHASIEAVFQQSWCLLSDSERQVLARLTVFRGGFSAEAARAVAGASVPVLGALADKSLLRKDGPRMSLHPLVQQLAAERLGEARAATQQAHGRHFHRQLAQMASAVQHGEPEALNWIDVEVVNCRVAWRWASAEGDGAALTKTLPALHSYCHHRGWYEACLSLLCTAIDSPVTLTDAVLRARLEACAAQVEYRLDRYAQAESRALRAADLARRAKDGPAQRRVFTVLGSCGLRLGRYDEARRYFEQVLRSDGARDDPHVSASVLDHLALVEKYQGRQDDALRLSLQALAQHRALGDAGAEALCLNNLGSLHMEQRDFAAAGLRLREGLAVCDQSGLVALRAMFLANLSEVALMTGDIEAGLGHARRALGLAESGRNRVVAAATKLQLARLTLRRNDLIEARAALADGLRLAIELNGRPLLLAGAMCFAELLVAQGERLAARMVLLFAEAHLALSAGVRDEMRALRATLPEFTGPPPAWPALDLDDLVHRIVVESDRAHGSLIAALRGEAPLS